MNHRQISATRALSAAIRYFAEQGYRIFTPLGDSGKYDLLVVDEHDTILRIQVKYSSQRRQSHLRTAYTVGLLCHTRRQQREHVVLRYDAADFDWLFVLRADGIQHLVPIAEVAGKSSYAVDTAFRVSSTPTFQESRT